MKEETKEILGNLIDLQDRIRELEAINEEHRKINGTLHQKIELLEKELEQWKKKYGDR